jgi:hypothetical protein
MPSFAAVEVREGVIVHVRMMRPPTESSYREYLDELGATFRRLDRYSFLITANDVRLSARYRELQSEWLNAHRAEFQGHWVSSAFVLRTRIERGALMALYWLYEPFYEYKVFADEEPALSWTREKLREAGVPFEESLSG